jgi:hypothetical protein
LRLRRTLLEYLRNCTISSVLIERELDIWLAQFAPLFGSSGFAQLD